MHDYAPLLAFMALYDRLGAPPVTPGERLAILADAVKIYARSNHPPGTQELVSRLVADLTEKPLDLPDATGGRTQPMGRPARKRP